MSFKKCNDSYFYKKRNDKKSNESGAMIGTVAGLRACASGYIYIYIYIEQATVGE